MDSKSTPKRAETTLGDLLYADRSTAPVREEEWVRLVRSVAGGDQAAMRALFERTHRLVFTLAVRISGSREVAEEVTLDVFQDVWTRAAKYDPAGGPVVGWIMNQARSRAIDRLRFDRRKKRVAPSDPQPAEAEDAEAPGDAHDAVQRQRSLREALATLSVEERRAVETAFFSELTYTETATRLDQPVGTVKTRIRSGLAKLRKILDGQRSVS